MGSHFFVVDLFSVNSSLAAVVCFNLDWNNFTLNVWQTNLIQVRIHEPIFKRLYTNGCQLAFDRGVTLLFFLI